ncbi:MAG: 30S ribosomal protein S6 [Rickettsiales bacterium]
MAFYETTFIVRQDVSANELSGIIESAEKAAQDANAKIIKKEKWGLLSLAYPIKKNFKGHYVHFGLEGEASLPAVMEKEFRRQIDSVIRHLTVLVDFIGEGESHVLRANARGTEGNN